MTQGLSEAGIESGNLKAGKKARKSAVDKPLLQVENLTVEFSTYGGIVKAVRGVNFSVSAGKTLAIVGESGCGKSVTVQSMMGLIPMPPGRITEGSAHLRGQSILGNNYINGKDIRGSEIGMIFQDPMTSLNPTMTIGDQIAEPLQVHKNLTHKQAFKKAIELLKLTRIPEAEKRARQYPFEFSGGMLQRAMIAMAIACKPTVLIADEPTTALDVTIQAQILDLLHDLQQETGMAIILITHDLGVVARMADEVAVMYAGKIVESGSVDDVFYRSSHPYTLGLKAAMPNNDPKRQHALQPIAGSPPDLFSPPPGCGYCPRCPYSMQICNSQHPPEFYLRYNSPNSRPNARSATNTSTDANASSSPELASVHYSRCWLHHDLSISKPVELYFSPAGRRR